MKIKDLLDEGRKIQESFKRTILKEDDVPRKNLKVDLMRTVDTIGKSIGNSQYNLLKDFSKKMESQYGPMLEKFFEPYIGKPLPAELVKLLNAANHEKDNKLPPLFPNRLESAKARVVGVGTNPMTVGIHLKFEAGVEGVFYLWHKNRNMVS